MSATITVPVRVRSARSVCRLDKCSAEGPARAADLCCSAQAIATGVFQTGHYVRMPEPPYIYDADGFRQGATNQPGEERALRIPKTDLTFVRIDHQTRLQFDDTEVVIESPFVLLVGGATYELDPGERTGLGPILACYPDTLEEATVDDSATLSLRFVSGVTIMVEQDPQYEAWQVNWPGNYLVVCTPGTDGKLAIWP